jgi:hypothetical protein
MLEAVLAGNADSRSRIVPRFKGSLKPGQKGSLMKPKIAEIKD